MEQRALSEIEKTIIARFADSLPKDERDQLIADMSNALATPMTDNGSLIRFDVIGYKHPPYKGQRPFRVAGKIVDRDGVELSVLLHTDENGRLYELEFIRWGGGTILEPDLTTLKSF